MKALRFVAIALVICTLAVLLVACGGGGNSNNIKVKCTVSVSVDGNYIIDAFEFEATGTKDSAPSVLKACEDALILNDIGYEMDAEGKQFDMICDIDGTEYRAGMDATGENMCAWVYTINGEEPNSKAVDTKVKEGMIIEFSYYRIPTGSNSEAE